MGGDANTHSSVVAGIMVLTSGVRLPARRVVYDRVIIRSDSAVQLGGAALRMKLLRTGTTVSVR
jgi:hypothetical protein